VSIEEAAAGGQDGRPFADSKIGESPGRLRCQHVRRTPPGAGDVAETLDRVH
jgi:hypothetical protein